MAQLHTAGLPQIFSLWWILCLSLSVTQLWAQECGAISLEAPQETLLSAVTIRVYPPRWVTWCEGGWSRGLQEWDVLLQTELNTSTWSPSLPPAHCCCCCCCANSEGPQPGKCMEENQWQRQMSRFRGDWVCWSTVGRRTALHSLDVSAKAFWEKEWSWETSWEAADSSSWDSGMQEWV